MKEGRGRRGQSFIIHLEFFQPYYVTSPVLCSRETGEEELDSAFKEPIAWGEGAKDTGVPTTPREEVHKDEPLPLSS